MKKKRLLNADISAVIASMGHTDKLAIGDAGLPVPECTPRIDLAVVRGLPPFIDVLEAVLDELEVEEITIAEEMEEQNPELFAYMMKKFADIRINTVMHTQLKLMTGDCRAVIRTGECKPFANIILHSGVAFEEK